MTDFQKKTMDELFRPDSETYKNSEHLPAIVILDNVRSMNNVGSTFRTSDAFLIDKIILSGITPTPPHREIQKTALGATESVNWEYLSECTERIKQYKQEGYTIIAIEQVHNSISLENWECQSKEKVVFIFGNEVDGVSEEILTLCDLCLEIPQFGSKHSLNISVSVGIILWEYLKKNITQ